MAVKTQHRVFALVMALLFLGTAIASSAVVVWQISQDNKQAKLQEDLESQLSGQASTQDTQSQQGNQPQEGKLEGTKLANFTPGAKVESLQITDIKEGTGDPVKAGATVTAHYTGALVSDGTIFQSSKDTGQPFTAPLSNLIKGWQDGIPGMKPGGVRRLVIPAAQAYGSQSQPGIPANSDLVFDIELVSVQ
jgi:FKBP-type peptidyl-prolyl cis-trans isomerase